MISWLSEENARHLAEALAAERGRPDDAKALLVRMIFAMMRLGINFEFVGGRIHGRHGEDEDEEAWDKP